MANETSARRYRLFIAISLPEEVKTAIEKAQVELRRAAPEDCVRWTRREQFHLTLRFLGDVEAERLDPLTDALRRACKNFPPLRLRAEQIGFFPDMRFPRVVWVWVHDDVEELPLLQKAVASAVVDFAREESEERFTGHVTLGRGRASNRAEAEKMSGLALGMADRFFGEWTADKVELMRSELSPQGARYTTLAAVLLTGESGSGKLPK